MILRGLLIAAAGFVFIFSPGVPLSLLTRRAPAIERGLIYWGLGLWPAALIPAFFLQSLLRQALYGSRPANAMTGQPLDYLFTLSGALISALLLQGGMWLVMRFKKAEPQVRLAWGLSLGFGIGLISQVFTGLGLVGAGFRLMFGPGDDPLLAALAQAGGAQLAVSLLPLVLFRPALLAISAACGLLVARSLGEGMRPWWIAVAVSALFAWLAVVLQIAFGSQNPGQIVAGTASPLAAAAAAVYYIAAFALAYAWIVARLEPRPGPAPQTAKPQSSAAVR